MSDSIKKYTIWSEWSDGEITGHHNGDETIETERYGDCLGQTVREVSLIRRDERGRLVSDSTHYFVRASGVTWRQVR